MVLTEPIPPAAFVVLGIVVLIVAVPLWIFVDAVIRAVKTARKRD